MAQYALTYQDRDAAFAAARVLSVETARRAYVYSLNGTGDRFAVVPDATNGLGLFIAHADRGSLVDRFPAGQVQS